MTPLSIPADLARDLEASAFKLAALVKLIDVVHWAALDADHGKDTVESAAANGLSTLIEVTAEVARSHCDRVECIFSEARKTRK